MPLSVPCDSFWISFLSASRSISCGGMEAGNDVIDNMDDNGDGVLLVRNSDFDVDVNGTDDDADADTVRAGLLTTHASTC